MQPKHVHKNNHYIVKPSSFTVMTGFVSYSAFVAILLLKFGAVLVLTAFRWLGTMRSIRAQAPQEYGSKPGMEELICPAYLHSGGLSGGRAWLTWTDLSALPETLNFIGAVQATSFNRQPFIRDKIGNLVYAPLPKWKVGIECIFPNAN